MMSAATNYWKGQGVAGVTSVAPNVQEALGTVLEQTSADPLMYRIELLFSFKGVKRVEVPEERMRPT